MMIIAILFGLLFSVSAAPHNNYSNNALTTSSEEILDDYWYQLDKEFEESMADIEKELDSSFPSLTISNGSCTVTVPLPGFRKGVIFYEVYKNSLIVVAVPKDMTLGASYFTKPLTKIITGKDTPLCKNSILKIVFQLNKNDENEHIQDVAVTMSLNEKEAPKNKLNIEIFGKNEKNDLQKKELEDNTVSES